MTKKLNLNKLDSSATIDELQRIKLQAEIIKIQEETSQIKKPWFLKASFFNIFVSLSVPVLTILLAYFFGGGKEFFDVQRLNLEYDKKILSSQVDSFRKDTIGLRKKYLSVSKELFEKHAQDSVTLDNKLFEVNSKLNFKEKQLEIISKNLQGVTDELKKDKVTIPVEL